MQFLFLGVILTNRTGGLFIPAVVTGSERYYLQRPSNQNDFDDEIVPIYTF